MSYSFTGVSIALVIYVVFSMVAFGLAYYASTLLATVPTVALNATIVANNKTASSLIQSGAWVSLLPLLLVFIFGLFFIFNTYNTPFSGWYYALYVIALIALIAAIVLIGLGIGYIDSSTANTNSASARTWAFVAAILLIVCMFPIIYMIYRLYVYNNTIGINNVEGIELMSITTNSDYPSKIIDQEIIVNSTLQDKPTTITENGRTIVSKTAPVPRERTDVFIYNNGLIKKVSDNEDVEMKNIKKIGDKYYYEDKNGVLTPAGKNIKEKDVIDERKKNKKLPDNVYDLGGKLYQKRGKEFVVYKG